MWLHYRKVGWRSLMQNRVYVVLSVVSLAVGMVLFSGTYRFLESADEAVMRLPGADRSVILRFYDTQENMRYRRCLYEEVKAIEDMQLPDVERIFGWYVDTGYEEEVERGDGKKDVHFLHTRPIYGDLSTDFAGHLLYGNRLPQRPDEVVLSASAARRINGEASPVGLVLRDVLQHTDTGPVTYRVVNVVEDFDFGRPWRAELYTMMSEKYTGPYLTVYIRMKPGGNVQRLQKQLEDSPLGMKWAAENSKVKLLPVSDDPDNTWFQIVRGILLGVVSLVLFSGLICFLVFVVYRFYNRQRELALRVMMGSGPGGLGLLLFTEIAMVLTAACALAFVLTELVMEPVNNFSQLYIGYPMLRSLGDILLTELWIYAVLLVAGLVVALAAGWRSHRLSIIGRVTRNRRRHVVRNTLLGVQLIVSTFLVGGLIGFYQMTRITDSYTVHTLSEDEEQRVLRLHFPYETMRLRQKEILAALSDRLRPEKMVNLRDKYMTGIVVDDKDVVGNLLMTTTDYFDFYRIPMQHLTADTSGGDGVYVCQRLYDMMQACGVATIRMRGKEYAVAGVYPELYYDMDRWRNSDDSFYSVLMPVTGDAVNETCCLLLPEGTSPEEGKQLVEQVCHEYVPGSLPIQVEGVGEGNTYRLEFGILIVFCLVLVAVSLMLVAMGVYSAVSMDTAGRQKEMALRKIYGATGRDIAGRLLRLYVVLLVVAITMAAPLLLFFFTEFQRDDVNILDGAFVLLWPLLVLAVMGTCVAVTVFTKIRQVVRVNPIHFIRTE